MEKQLAVSGKARPDYHDSGLPVEERVNDLLSRMTMEEKIAQTLQIVIGRDDNVNNQGKGDFFPEAGSVLAFRGGVSERNRYQEKALGTRLGIPILWGCDVIHGWRTIFPHSWTQAFSFNPELTEAACRWSAYEACYAGGMDWTFAPMVEVAHDPRWGRLAEGYGEDPYTAARFTEAAVRGFQGQGGPGTVAACLKHFVGYSASEAGCDYAYTDLSRRALHEWYLPPFEAGVKAGAKTLMSSFNDIGGHPGVCCEYTLQEILRRRWGFRGFVVSDWAAVQQLANQGFSADPAVQSAACLNAGNDMDMVDAVYRAVPEAIRRGLMTEETLDRAVRNILRVKFELGLFEHPLVEERPSAEILERPEALQTALDCARESIVLLKNDHELLPLAPGKYRRIALVGPLARDRMAHSGSWRGPFPNGESFADVIGKFFPDAEIQILDGCDPLSQEEADFAPLLEQLKHTDLILAAVGEPANHTGEDVSYCDISLPGRQLELLKALCTLGKPLVGCAVIGRPLDSFPQIHALTDALLLLGNCGCRGARACFEILTGAVNPSGKLAVSFPRHAGQIPVYYNKHRNARPEKNHFQDQPESPFYEFGSGMSYTTFDYGELKQNDMTFSFELTNTGKRPGKEVVFWYLSDPEASLTQPVRRLIAFEKVALGPGECRTIRLTVDPMRDLAYPDEDGKKVFEPGEFILEVSRRRSISFTIALFPKKVDALNCARGRH